MSKTQMENKIVTDLLNSEKFSWLKCFKDRICFISILNYIPLNEPVEDLDIAVVLAPTKEQLIGIEGAAQTTAWIDYNYLIKEIYAGNEDIKKILQCQHFIIFNDIGNAIIENAAMILDFSHNTLPNRAKVNDFLIEMNSKIVNDTVSYYVIPLEIVEV